MTSTRKSAISRGYGLSQKRQYAIGSILLLVLLQSGCSSSGKTFISPSYVRAGDWIWKDLAGQNIQTTHYLIHTTVTDPEKLDQFARLMEVVYQEYQKIYPGPKTIESRLEVFYFAQYDQWAAYTIFSTGDNARTYLSVFNGAYTLGDKFVCWDGNHLDTLQSAAHEGFHQYVSRTFKTRLPPAIEEGLACSFENLRLDGSRVVIDPSRNPRRETALRQAEGKVLFPLETLLQLHAGDLAEKSPELNELYYAQAWALGSFLRKSPEYQQQFHRMITDTAMGDLPKPVAPNDEKGRYFPARIKPQMMHYFGENWAEFEEKYLRFLRQIVAKSENVVE